MALLIWALFCRWRDPRHHKLWPHSWWFVPSITMSNFRWNFEPILLKHHACAFYLVKQTLVSKVLTVSWILSLAVWLGVHLACTLRELCSSPMNARVNDVLKWSPGFECLGSFQISYYYQNRTVTDCMLEDLSASGHFPGRVPGG